MESIAKVKRIVFLLFAVMIFPLMSSCRTVEQPVPVVVVHDPLVIQEVTPIPRAVIIARQQVPEFEPVFATLRILEVAEINGVQRYFLVRVGADRTGIAVGVTGDIIENSVSQRVIGSYRIVELLGDFFRSEITDLAYRIGPNAHMRIQVGEVLRVSTM